MRALFMLSLCLGAIILVPSGTHLLEMPRKLLITREAYFSAQQMYLGWALFGIPIVLKIVVDGLLAVRLWRLSPASARASLLSGFLIATGLVVFFIWVQPANAATSNWSLQPSGWATLRTQWEYGHAAIACLTLLAFCATSYGVIRGAPAVASNQLRT